MLTTNYGMYIHGLGLIRGLTLIHEVSFLRPHLPLALWESAKLGLRDFMICGQKMDLLGFFVCSYFREQIFPQAPSPKLSTIDFLHEAITFRFDMTFGPHKTIV